MSSPTLSTPTLSLSPSTPPPRPTALGRQDRQPHLHTITAHKIIDVFTSDKIVVE
ncbi:hypothetical protein QJS04_geneDACA007149 [Acorus gramineus]|uniref:Uncharacterized protein n=1 Tax=Acorus gramineus TaxID=55184 RepID=A0AAV9BQ91_ACOGR|nr:hypothetical protein QJS04_geneDACA007149 [Acorus gramineus]